MMTKLDVATHLARTTPMSWDHARAAIEMWSALFPVEPLEDLCRKIATVYGSGLDPLTVFLKIDVDTPRLCPTKTPEEHILGEFPMTCYNCHMHADS